MTIIFEYELPVSRTLRGWGEAWHGLGAMGDFGEDYKRVLQAFTDSIAARNASPNRTNGSALGQVWSNESALDWIWQMREFTLGPDGQLHLHTVRNTPSGTLNGTGALAAYLAQNTDAIRSNSYTLPAFLLGGSADQLVVTWSFPTLDPATNHAFANGTCNGCHSQEHPSIDTAFHISPYRRGTDKVSKYLNDPSQPQDELSKREGQLRSALCAP